MKKLFILCFLCCTLNAIAQDNCLQQPAPCPHSSEISNSMNTEDRTENNVSFPQELAMENKLRNAVTDEVQRIAKAKGWSVYEVNERGGNYSPPYIYISRWNWEATPFNKRTPDNYIISFIFITNNDSLQAWKNYLLNDFQSQMKEAAANGASIYNNPKLKAYSDSLQLNMQQTMKFSQENNAEYTQALKTNNQKKIDAYTKKLNEFRAKSEYYQKQQEAIGQSYKQEYDNVVQRLYKRSNLFAESSIALVNFDFNPFNPGYFDVQQGVDVNKLPKRKISVPNAFLSGVLTTNVEPYDNNYNISSYSFLFNHPFYDAAILFGSYLSPDEYGHYKPMFTKGHHDKQSVLGNVKAITCDKVQNIAVHIESSNHSIDEIVSAIDWQKIYGLIDSKN